MENVLRKKLIGKIAQKYFLDLILLFGSRAAGRTYRGSDFDVAYSGKKTLDLEKEAELIIELAPIFGSENIDLVNLKKAPPLLFYGITKDCQVIYAKNSLIFPIIRAYAFKKYVETKPLYEEKVKRLKKEIKQYK